MDKETSTPHGPPTPDGVLGLAEKPNGAETTAASKTSDESKVHEFNEQTNYVPKRTIITVWYSSLAALKPRKQND